VPLVLESSTSSNPAIALLEVESLILDRKDGPAALSAAAKFQSSPDRTPQQRVQIGLYTAEAQLLTGAPADARAPLEALAKEFPGNRRVTERLAALQRSIASLEFRVASRGPEGRAPDAPP
jgi:hypothetical protein